MTLRQTVSVKSPIEASVNKLTPRYQIVTFENTQEGDCLHKVQLLLDHIYVAPCVLLN